MKHKRKFRLSWLLWVIPILIAWVIITHSAEVNKITAVLKQGKWEWVLVAASIQVAYYLEFTLLYHSCFNLVQVRCKYRDLIPAMFASVFANLAPTGGTGGAAVFIHQAVRRNQSGARASIGALLVQITDFGSFILVLVIGLVYLLVQHSLRNYQIIAAVIMMLFVGAMVTILLLALWQTFFISKILHLFQRVINKISRIFRHNKNLLGDDWAILTANELKDAAQTITSQPRDILITLWIALSTHILDILSIYAIFLAFNQPVRVGVLISGYALTHLFTTVAITPQGIGVVEGVMAIVYNSLGISIEKAAVIALAYRGLNLWLPLLIGFFLMRKLKFSRTQE